MRVQEKHAGDFQKRGKLADIEFIFISKLIYIFPNWFNNNQQQTPRKR